jgi:hypothetical protein
MSAFRRLSTLLAIFAAVFIMACNSSSTGSAATTESEPNNEAETADKITVGTPLTGEILADDEVDQDWYEFKAKEGETYLIRTRYTTDSTDTKIELWGFDEDDDAYLLDENDDIDDESEDYNAGIEWTCETSGTYYFVVSGYEDDEEGSYKVSVTKE